jgi:hypothetical protein
MSKSAYLILVERNDFDKWFFFFFLGDSLLMLVKSTNGMCQWDHKVMHLF